MIGRQSDRGMHIYIHICVDSKLGELIDIYAYHGWYISEFNG